MINVGIAGIGFMGMTHYLAYEKIRGARVVAICEKDRKRLSGDWRTIKGNFGPPGRKMDLRGIDAYGELDQMLANPKLDAIDVCLPPSLHADVTLAALKAGKHVLCEKPIALEAADGRRMVAAAERVGKMLMVGHVLPFFPEYAFAYKVVSKGKYGRLLGGSFKRMISDPLWLPDFYNPQTVGGPMLDLHVHDAHFIRLLFGMPQSVQSVGSMRGKVVERFNSQFRFEDSNLMVTAGSGVIDQQARPFLHGFEIYLEKATLLFEGGTICEEPVGTPLTVLDNRGRALRPKLPEVDPFVAELTEVTRSINRGTVSPLLGGELARDALTLCCKQTQSVARGRAVKI